MKMLVSAAVAALLIASAAQAQTAPSGSSVTRDLNSRPPASAGSIAPTPARPAEAPVATRPATPAPAASTPRPSSTAPAASARPTAAPATSAATPPAPVAATTTPAAAPNPPPPPPNVPAVTVLNASARAALPFTLDLPTGFELVTGRPGPDFKIYTVRRGGKSFAMIYAGPASQFPIYSGEQVQAGGRTSVVKAEAGQRRAVEHLFQRPEAAGAPREIHVWTMSLDGADRALAERIAQSVDAR